MSNCDDQPTLVDCEYNELPVVTDPLGNPVVQFCPPDSDTFPPVNGWNSDVDDLPPDDPCIAGFYFDLATGCISHYCHDRFLYPFCATGGSEPVVTEICYDLNTLGPGPYCFGGGVTGWYLNGVNQYVPDCYDPNASTQPVDAFASVSAVLVNPDYSNSSGHPPPQGDLPGLYGNATNTGQTSPVTVSGDPAGSPYFGATRPTIFIDHNATDPDCVGPLCFSFTNTITSGAIGMALWHRPTDTFADITFASAPASSISSYYSPAGYGDYVIFNTSGSGGGPHKICYGNTDGMPASEFTIVVFALGGNDPNPIEELDNLEFEYVRQENAVNDCCECLTAAEIAAVMTAQDTTAGSGAFTATGNVICGTVIASQAGNYGPLVSCEGSVGPNDQLDPPVFTSSPPPTICVDEETEFCAECEGGQVTLQQLVNGVWTDV